MLAIPVFDLGLKVCAMLFAGTHPGEQARRGLPLRDSCAR